MNKLDSAEVLTKHGGLVRALAERAYHRHGVDAEDLYAEGCQGLLIALEKFDPARGIKFSTYATWWVRQKINTHVEKVLSEWTVSFHHFKKTNKQFSCALDISEMSETLRCSDLGPEKRNIRRQTAQLVRSVVSSVELDERNKVILTERLLADEPLTLAELAEKLHISIAAVGYREQTLLRKLKTALSAAGLDSKSISH